MPFVVTEADVAAIDINVLGLSPRILPATALIPICAPMLGLYATFGMIVIPDGFLVTSTFLFG